MDLGRRGIAQDTEPAMNPLRLTFDDLPMVRAAVERVIGLREPSGASEQPERHVTGKALVEGVGAASRRRGRIGPDGGVNGGGQGVLSWVNMLKVLIDEHVEHLAFKVLKVLLRPVFEHLALKIAQIPYPI